MFITTQIIPGISGTGEFILLIVLTAAGSIILSGLLFRKIRRYGAYAYANARVKAMKGRLFRGEKLKPLEQSQDIQNLVSHLKDSPYSDELEGVKETKTRKIEMSIQLHLVKARKKIVKLAPDEIRGIFKEMAKIHELENLKSLFIAKYQGEPPEETEKKLLPIDFIPDDIYDQAIGANDLEETVTAFEGTEYWNLLEDVRTELEEKENLLPLWHKLEKNYWKRSWKAAKNSDTKYSDTLQEVLGKKIDVRNVLTVLRCKGGGIEPEEIEKYLIPIHTKIEPENLERARESESLEEALAAFEDTAYGKAISEVRSEFEETGSIYVIEKALNEFLLRKAKTISIQKSTGVGPLVRMFYEKEAEVKNLIAIVNGKEEGRKPEEIREELVTFGGEG